LEALQKLAHSFPNNKEVVVIKHVCIFSNYLQIDIGAIQNFSRGKQLRNFDAILLIIFWGLPKGKVGCL